ncbi:MAG: hypothetical protein ACI3Y0_01855 [Prevotella sp.]
MKQRLLLFVSTLVFSIVFSNSALAYVEVDGFYYNFMGNDKDVEITSGNNKYEGEVSIPSVVFR